MSRRSDRLALRMLLGLELTLLCLTPLAACRTTAGVATKPPTTPVVCLAFQPIRWSKADTPETQKQARAHNAAGASLCGWRP